MEALLIESLLVKNMKKYWFNIPDKLRFIFVGCFNASMSYLIFSCFCLILGVASYQMALALAWVCSSVISFSTHKFLVFKGNGLWFKEYLKCCTTWFFSYLINATVLEILVRYLRLNVFVAQIFATMSCAIFTYILFKKFAFTKRAN